MAARRLETARTSIAKKAANRSASRPANKARGARAAAPSGARPNSIDDYLRTLSAERRAVLEQLRKTIHKALPDLEECISYSMPAFRHRGKVVAGFLATRSGFSYFPFSGTTLGTLANQLRGRSQTKSALHFTSDAPLPVSLVRTLLKARLAELA